MGLTMLGLTGARFSVVCADVLPGDAQLISRQVATSGPDLRVPKLAFYLKSHNSPLAPYAATFVKEADKNGLDWRLLAAISGVESTFGQAIPSSSYNAWGWGVFTGMSYGIYFKDWQDGITRVSKGLKTNYLDKGAESVEEIGRIYAASPAWSRKVRFFINQIDNFIASRPELIEVNL